MLAGCRRLINHPAAAVAATAAAPARQMERRERLRKLVAEHEGDLPLEGAAVGQLVVEEVVSQRELFFSEACEELVAARRQIGEYSVRRAKKRLATARERQEDESRYRVSSSSITHHGAG